MSLIRPNRMPVRRGVPAPRPASVHAPAPHPCPPCPPGISYTVPTVMPRVVIVDHGGTGVDPAELPKVALALTRQACEHFAAPPPLGYGIGAVVRTASGPADIKPGEWVLGLFASADVPGALGYHDETPSGMPLLKVFPELDREDGVLWSTTASHELLETLADPNLAKMALAPDGKAWAIEVCDAVEALFYDIDGVKVSDFVLPPYFEPPSRLAGVKLDWMGAVKRPYDILPGGYGQWWDGRSWHMVQPPGVRAYRQDAAGRAAARRAIITPAEAPVETPTAAPVAGVDD